ncbi:protein of unknown function [Desulfovibrio sp. 86]|nr:protein of unknown function [Desulfovibrio sp. 86]
MFARQNFGEACLICCFLTQEKDHAQARIFWYFFSQPDVSCPLIQREPARWHCAARREITERSEEAPGAEAAQPSQNGGVWKALEG